MKWKDKRYVLLLSTKHSDETVVMQKKGNIIIKPKIIEDYNEGKSYVNLSDQMPSYCRLQWKSVKWYKKIVFEFCLNAAVVNAWIIYNSPTKQKISSVEFQKKLSTNQMSYNNNNNSLSIGPKRNCHETKKKEDNFN